MENASAAFGARRGEERLTVFMDPVELRNLAVGFAFRPPLRGASFVPVDLRCDFDLVGFDFDAAADAALLALDGGPRLLLAQDGGPMKWLP